MINPAQSIQGADYCRHYLIVRGIIRRLATRYILASFGDIQTLFFNAFTMQFYRALLAPSERYICTK
jgi:hypothetical protein